MAELYGLIVAALRRNIDLLRVSSIGGVFTPSLPHPAEHDTKLLGYILSRCFTDTPKTTLQEQKLLPIASEHEQRSTRDPREVIGTVNQRAIDMGIPASCMVLPFIPLCFTPLLSRLTASHRTHEIHVVFEQGCDTTLFRLRHAAPWAGLDRQIADIDGALVRPFSLDTGGEEEVEDEIWIVFKDIKWADIRRRVRDKSCNGRWDQFSYLTAILPPGGTLNHDDKGYCIPWPFPALPFTPQNLLRFERGQPVCQFADPRADIRCVSEGQVMEIKGRWNTICGWASINPEGKGARVVVSGLSYESAAIPGILGQVFDLPVYSCSTASTLLSAILANYAISQPPAEETFPAYARSLLKSSTVVASTPHDVEQTPTPRVSFLPTLEQAVLIAGHVPPSPARTPPSLSSTRSITSSSSVATSVSSHSSCSTSSLISPILEEESAEKALEIVPEEEHVAVGEEEEQLKLLFESNGDTYPSMKYASMRSEFERLSSIVRHSRFIPPSLPTPPQTYTTWQGDDWGRVGFPGMPAGAQQQQEGTT
ncbi:hypothetical protein IAR50_005809 [Cryptococcus sp. DSM 104548]